MQGLSVLSRKEETSCFHSAKNIGISIFCNCPGLQRILLFEAQNILSKCLNTRMVISVKCRELHETSDSRKRKSGGTSCGRPLLKPWNGWAFVPLEDIFSISYNYTPDFSDGLAGKESACNVGDLGSIAGLGRSPGEGKGYPLQHFGLENSRDCIVYGVAKSRTRLNTFHFLSHRYSVS